MWKNKTQRVRNMVNEYQSLQLQLQILRGQENPSSSPRWDCQPCSQQSGVAVARNPGLLLAWNLVGRLDLKEISLWLATPPHIRGLWTCVSRDLLVKFFLICHTSLIIPHCLEHLLDLVNSVVSKFCFSEKVLVDTLYALVYLWEQSVLKFHRWVQCTAITQSN